MLEELENIDDDTDRHGIGFVKTQDLEIAEAYGVHELPSLIYFEKGSPSIYEGMFPLSFTSFEGADVGY